MLSKSCLLFAALFLGGISLWSAHPLLNNSMQMNLPIQQVENEKLQKLAEKLSALSMEELEKEVAEQTKSIRFVNERAGDLEDLANYYARHGVKRNDSAMVERAMRIMNTVARTTRGNFTSKFSKSVHETRLNFFNAGTTISPFLYGFDLIWDRPEWNNLHPGAKEEVVQFFVRSSWSLLRALSQQDHLHNMHPHAAERGAAAALVLQSPELMRGWINFCDRFISETQILADGVYCDYSPSYQEQVYNHLSRAMQSIRQFRDPEGFEDIYCGIRLDGSYDFDSRWPLYAPFVNAYKHIRLPDGRPLPLGDTHCQTPATPLPIQPELCQNFTAPIFGLFSLNSGKDKDFRQLWLSATPLAIGYPYSGGHPHMDSLSILLWAGHHDILPDSGYPKYSEKFSSHQKYFFHNIRNHNTAFVWSIKDEPYTRAERQFTRPRLLLLEDGSASDGAIQALSIASPGPRSNNVETRQRDLLLIRNADGKSYTVDLFRLKGGERHEAYFRQTEDEECRLDTAAAPMTGSLKEILTIPGAEGHNKWLDFFKNPQKQDGAQPQTFAFCGERSGNQLRFHLNPQPDAVHYYTQIPNLRRFRYEHPLDANGKRDVKFGEITDYHLTRTRAAVPNQTTIFGAVFEAILSGDAPVVQQVEWFDAGENAAALKITHSSGCDYVASLPDAASTYTFPGTQMTVKGKLSVIRTNAAGAPYGAFFGGLGNLSWQGKIRAANFSNAEYSARIRAAAEDDPANVIRLAGKRNLQVGEWLYSRFGDGSGFGVRIKSFVHENNDTIVTLTGGAGFRSLGTRVQISINGEKADCNGAPEAFIRRSRYVPIK